MLAAQVIGITVQADSIGIELVTPGGVGDGPEGQSRQIVSLPWSKKPLRATKGAIGGPATTPGTSEAAQAVLAAVGKARRWVEEIMDGCTSVEVATREGKSERYIRQLMPLAVLSPAALRRLIDRNVNAVTVTEMTRNIPILWPASTTNDLDTGRPNQIINQAL